jgi:D-alanyl-D-alanine carboxypeptidase/D-alanyl-D-alanine-endopeptidase (penicillin-binding protein 4)
MKKNKTNVAGFFALAILCFGLNFGIATSAQVNKPNVNPTPTPKQTPTAKPIITPMPPTIQPCQTTALGCPPNGVLAKPSTTPTPTPTPPQYKDLWEVQRQIQNVLTRPELQRGQIGVKIVSLDSDKTVFDVNSEKYFMPASNMKSYTVAAAIEKLSPDFKFVTSVYAPAVPDANGVIKGDLTIFGRGDVSFSTAFYDGDYYKGLDALTDKIAQAGVKRIEGNLVGDESYFTGNPIPSGWEWDDLQWYYGAEISALAVNDNAVDLSVKPSSAINAPCGVSVLPANTIIKIVNRCVTSAVGSKRDLQVFKKIDQNIVEISGTMPLEDKEYKGYVAVSRPAQLFVELLRGRLMQKGIVVTGQNKVINAKDKEFTSVVSTIPPVEIAKLESPPLALIAAKTLKPSQNTYTETILWTLGEQIGRKQELALATDEDSIKKLQKTPSADVGLKTVQRFLNEIGIAPDSVIQWDGSGLSRHNLITPNSAVALYTYMSKSRYANVWRDALTIGATDGTLKNRFKDTIAAGNVRGKTGTIDQVSSLSGYVTTAAGERMVFSILVNGVNDVRLRQAAIDEIVVALAKFNGKTNQNEMMQK